MTTFINDEFSVVFDAVRKMLREMPDLDEVGEHLHILVKDLERRRRADRYRAFQMPGPVTAVWESNASCWYLTFRADGKHISLVGEDGLGDDAWPWRGQKVVPTDGRDWYWWRGGERGLPVGPYKTEQEAIDAAAHDEQIPF
jgi:hypothetical protein